MSQEPDKKEAVTKVNPFLSKPQTTKVKDAIGYLFGRSQAEVEKKSQPQQKQLKADTKVQPKSSQNKEKQIKPKESIEGLMRQDENSAKVQTTNKKQEQVRLSDKPLVNIPPKAPQKREDPNRIQKANKIQQQVKPQKNQKQPIANIQSKPSESKEKQMKVKANDDDMVMQEDQEILGSVKVQEQKKMQKEVKPQKSLGNSVAANTQPKTSQNNEKRIKPKQDIEMQKDQSILASPKVQQQKKIQKEVMPQKSQKIPAADIQSKLSQKKEKQRKSKGDDDDMQMQDDDQFLQSEQKNQQSSKQPVSSQPKNKPNQQLSINNNVDMQKQKKVSIQSNPKKNLAQDMRMEDDQQFLHEYNDDNLPQYTNNRKMVEFYAQETENLGQIGPLIHRYVTIIQKYMNQFRIIIQLSRISDLQLKQNNFDRSKYRELVNQKTKIFNQYRFPRKVSQKALDTPAFIEALDKLQKIQRQISPLESQFDQQYIRGLYQLPKEMLEMTKQELFQESLKHENELLEKDYEELKTDNKRLRQIFDDKMKQLSQLQQKQKLAKQKNEELFKQQKQKAKKTVFPDSDQQNKIIKESQFPSQYKVTIKNKQQMEKKLLELKNDGQLIKIKEELNKLMKQRREEQELLLKEKEKYQKYHFQKKKKDLGKEVYMGNVEKLKKHPKVMKLEKELKDLIQKWQEKQQEKPKNEGSGSGIRFFSRINQ